MINHIKFKFNKDKSIAAILYVLNKSETVDLKHLIATLYLSDKEHLLEYGRPILGDTYFAAQYGPVPTNIFDMLKVARGDENAYCLAVSEEEISNNFEFIGEYLVKAKQKGNEKILSQIEKGLLNKHFNKNKNKSFIQIAKSTHDAAWEKTNSIPNDKILYEDIIEQAKKPKALLQYIKDTIITEKAIENR